MKYKQLYMNLLKKESNLKLMQWNFTDLNWTMMMIENLNLLSKNVILIFKLNHFQKKVKVELIIWEFKLNKKNIVNKWKKWLRVELDSLCIIWKIKLLWKTEQKKKFPPTQWILEILIWLLIWLTLKGIKVCQNKKLSYPNLRQELKWAKKRINWFNNLSLS